MSSPIQPSTPGLPWQPPLPEDLQPELPAYEILGLLGRGGWVLCIARGSGV